MITRGLSCDRVEFGHFWGGGSDDPPDPPLATGLEKKNNSKQLDEVYIVWKVSK